MTKMKIVTRLSWYESCDSQLCSSTLPTDACYHRRRNTPPHHKLTFMKDVLTRRTWNPHGKVEDRPTRGRQNRTRHMPNFEQHTHTPPNPNYHFVGGFAPAQTNAIYAFSYPQRMQPSTPPEKNIHLKSPPHPILHTARKISAVC